MFNSELSLWLLVAASIYVVLLLLIGILGRRNAKAKTAADFFLAGRSVGVVILLLSLFATQYNGNTFIGYAANGYRDGFFFIVTLFMFGGVIAAYLLYAPRLRFLSSTRRYLTFGDYIQDRYGSRTLTYLVSAVAVIALINFIVTNLIAVGTIVNTISGDVIPYAWGIIGLALVMVIYENLGGLRSIAWTDSIQGVLIAVGGIVFLVSVFYSLGGVTAAFEQLSVVRPDFSLPPGLNDNLSWLSTVVLFIFGASIYPHAIQRVYAAKSAITLKKALVVMVFLPLITLLPAVLWGILGNIPFPGLSTIESERITPLLVNQIVQDSPVGLLVATIFLIGVLAAIMSTIDSALISTSSSLVNDFVRISDLKQPRLGKAFSWLIMALAVTIAIAFPSTIWQLIQLKFELLLPSAPSLFLGIHWKSLGGKPVLIGFIAALGLTLFLIIGSSLSDSIPARPFNIHAGVWGLLLNLTITVTLGVTQSLITRGKPLKSA